MHSFVSIQLLLLFYLNLGSLLKRIQFRFNTTLVTVLFIKADHWIYQRWFQYNSCYCSINTFEMAVTKRFWFQYNSCYCSIVSNGIIDYSKFMFQYNSCYCSILVLNLFTVRVIEFQYNSCYCSIPRKLALFKTIISQNPRKINTFLKFYQAHPFFGLSITKPSQPQCLSHLQPFLHFWRLVKIS